MKSLSRLYFLLSGRSRALGRAPASFLILKSIMMMMIPPWLWRPRRSRRPTAPLLRLLTTKTAVARIVLHLWSDCSASSGWLTSWFGRWWWRWDGSSTACPIRACSTPSTSAFMLWLCPSRLALLRCHLSCIPPLCMRHCFIIRWIWLSLSSMTRKLGASIRFSWLSHHYS